MLKERNRGKVAALTRYVDTSGICFQGIKRGGCGLLERNCRTTLELVTGLVEYERFTVQLVFQIRT